MFEQEIRYSDLLWRIEHAFATKFTTKETDACRTPADIERLLAEKLPLREGRGSALVPPARERRRAAARLGAVGLGANRVPLPR